MSLTYRYNKMQKFRKKRSILTYFTKKVFVVDMSSFFYVFLKFLPASSGKQMTATFSRTIPLYNLFNITSC